MSRQPRIQLRRIPFVRRAVQSQRTIQRLERENAARLEHLGHDVVALLQGAEATASGAATLLTEVATISDSTTSLRSQVAAAADRLGRLELRVAELASATSDLHARTADAGETIARLVPAVNETLGLVNETYAGSPEPSGVGILDLALCAYLAPFLHTARAIDAGAHRGLLTRALVSQGLEVIAVEPNPDLAHDLRTALADEPAATVAEVAVAAAPGRAVLYLPGQSEASATNDASLFGTIRQRGNVAELDFSAGPDVETTTLDELRLTSGWPEAVGLLKLDVEGAELEAMAGLGSTQPEILMAEFWERDHVMANGDVSFGVSPLVMVLKRLGMRRWVTLIHDEGRVTFMVNNHRAPAASWGNVFGFRDRETFMAAFDWCSTHLKPDRRELVLEESFGNA